jgi:hypothetical protein
MIDKKKALLAIVGVKPKKEEAAEVRESEESEESGEGMEYEAAAEDVISAMKSGDAKALAEALRAFVEMC